MKFPKCNTEIKIQAGTKKLFISLTQIQKRMKYEYAPDLQQRMIDIVTALNLNHVNLSRVQCLRSSGSSTKRIIARCHALGKLMQRAMQTKAFYAIEFLEPFEKLSRKNQDRTIIHELMHIPKTFGGGFRHHDFVCEKNVDILHEKFENLKRSLQNCPNFSKRTLKERNSAVSEAADFEHRFIQSSLKKTTQSNF